MVEVVVVMVVPSVEVLLELLGGMHLRDQRALRC